jgi:hypothetical protein
MSSDREKEGDTGAPGASHDAGDQDPLPAVQAGTAEGTATRPTQALGTAVAAVAVEAEVASRPNTPEPVADAAEAAEDGQPEPTSAPNFSVCMDSGGDSEGDEDESEAQMALEPLDDESTKRALRKMLDAIKGTRRRARAQHVDTLFTLDHTQKNMALGMVALDQKLALQSAMLLQMDEMWRQMDAGQGDLRDILVSEQHGVRRFGESLSQLEDRVERVELLPEQLANLQGQVRAGGATVRQLSKRVSALQIMVAGIQTSDKVS